MKKLYFSFILAILCFGGNAIAQCSSPSSSYDLIVASTIVRSGSNAGYMQGYVCNGGVLIDSATCCTRFVLVDSGGTMTVGPLSYGMAYVLNGGTFNGQNSSNNWQVIAEPNATVINHTGNNVPCAQITYTASNCIMSVPVNSSPKPNVSLVDHTLNFAFTSVVNDVSIEVFDVAGNVVRSEKVNQTSVHSMNLAGLAGGIYIYRVMQGTEVLSSDKVVLP
jgi:predicted extracellular nuclease